MHDKRIDRIGGQNQRHNSQGAYLIHLLFQRIRLKCPPENNALCDDQQSGKGKPHKTMGADRAEDRVSQSAKP